MKENPYSVADWSLFIQVYKKRIIKHIDRPISISVFVFEQTEHLECSLNTESDQIQKNLIYLNIINNILQTERH